MELFDRLLDIERKLWTNDAPVYRDTLLHDAILIFPETDVITTDAAVEAIRQERAAAISGCLADDVEWEIPGAVRLRERLRSARRSRTRPSWGVPRSTSPA